MMLRSYAKARDMLCVLLIVSAVHGYAQHTRPHAEDKASTAVPVLMLSDIHFEPFQDPGKVAQLRAAPIEQWPSILGAAPSATQAADFASLQKACPVRGVDASWSLFSTSLAQAAAEQPHPLFVTVSGDLLSHDFDCRFKTLAPKSSEDELSSFAAKTVAFVSAELRQSFPSSPVYLALGNNDSSCTDYREDRNSSFLQHTAEAFAHAAATGENGQTILREFSDEGDYNVALPAPMHDARLIVLQDIFDTPHYESCSGKPDPAPEAAQLAWLDAQLADARAHHQHVWVMAHIPPSVDMYSTVSQHRNICAGQAPVMFLDSEKMADVLTAYPDVIALAVFAHSHADELRYLHAAGNKTDNAAGNAAGIEAGNAAGIEAGNAAGIEAGNEAGGIPAKLVGSISPVNGNHPTFTLAQVDTRTAELLDYTVFLTGDSDGAKKEYSFREVYKYSSFSASNLRSLTHGFLKDSGDAAASQAYQRLYFPGDTGLHAAAMRLFWHEYACSLSENRPEEFRRCVCAVAPAAAQ